MEENAVENGVDYHNYHNSEYCSDPENGKKLEKEWEENMEKGWNYGGPNVETFFAQCLARSAVKLSADANSELYYSTGKNVFLNDYGDRFWITHGWGFSWTFRASEGSYMMEGRCDLIK
jgi:hypothetical protein